MAAQVSEGCAGVESMPFWVAGTAAGTVLMSLAMLPPGHTWMPVLWTSTCDHVSICGLYHCL